MIMKKKKQRKSPLSNIQFFSSYTYTIPYFYIKIKQKMEKNGARTQLVGILTVVEQKENKNPYK